MRHFNLSQKLYQFKLKPEAADSNITFSEEKLSLYIRIFLCSKLVNCWPRIRSVLLESNSLKFIEKSNSKAPWFLMVSEVYLFLVFSFSSAQKFAVRFTIPCLVMIY